jgi:hypothetical protein
MPTPDPWFERELRLIDPALRAIFAYERYFKTAWAIERRLSPDRYHACYKSLIDSGGPRFVRQPIFDTAQPLFNDDGEPIGFRVVGERDFDLAPEFEWVTFADCLDQRVLVELKRAYAWERGHPLSRLRFEKEQARLAAEAKAKERRVDEALQEVKDHRRELKDLPFAAVPGFAER